MGISRRMFMGAGAASALALAVDLNGDDNFLSKLGVFTGAPQSKEFTVAFPLYLTEDGINNNVLNFRDSVSTVSGFFIRVDTNGFIDVLGSNSADTLILNMTTTKAVPLYTFGICVVTANMATGAAEIYFEDEDFGTSITTITDDFIDFARDENFIATNSAAGDPMKGRGCPSYLDFAYRPLATESNLRIYSELSDTQGLITLNPDEVLSNIVDAGSSCFLSWWTNPEDQAEQLGSAPEPWGVDGTMARSEVGPNQYSSPSSKLTFGQDSLILDPAINFVPDGKEFFISAEMLPDNASGEDYVLTFNTNTSPKQKFKLSLVGGADLVDIRLRGYNSSGTLILSCDLANVFANKSSISVQCTANLANFAEKGLIVNGTDYTDDATWATYTDDNIFFSLSSGANDSIGVGGYQASSFQDAYNGNLGGVVFDNSYVPITTENPAYDAETNKPKYIPDGTYLIQLDMRADDAGNDRGNGGASWTVNSGPFTGARGLSETITRTIKGNGVDGLLRNDSPAVIPDGRKFSCVFYAKGTTTTVGRILYSGPEINIRPNFNASFVTSFKKSGVTRYARNSSAATTNVGHLMFMSFDLTDPLKDNMILNGVSAPAATTFVNADIGFGDILAHNIMGLGIASQCWDGEIGFLYAVDDYIPFDDEEFQLIFVDALGRPRDIRPAIEEGLIPQGRIQMGFRDLDEFGFNDGTVGDFDEYGPLDAGADAILG